MDPFVGEVRAVGFNFAPRGWALCQGQLIPIQQNTALFSVLGTYYGGNGTTTFALPDLRGRAVVNLGQGPGLSNYVQGQVSGTENVTLLQPNLPAHTHAVAGTSRVAANSTPGNQTSPANNFLGDSGNTVTQYGEESDGTLMSPALITGSTIVAGSGTPHNNMMPYLVTNYIIALTGIYPPRP